MINARKFNYQVIVTWDDNKDTKYAANYYFKKIHEALDKICSLQKMNLVRTIFFYQWHIPSKSWEFIEKEKYGLRT